MTPDELKQAAMECLGKALNGDTTIPAHIVQAALVVTQTLEAAGIDVEVRC